MHALIPVALVVASAAALVTTSLPDTGGVSSAPGETKGEPESLGIGVERAWQLGITPEVLAAHGVIATQAIETLNRLAAQDWSTVTTISAELTADQDALSAAQDAYMESRDGDAAQVIQRLSGEVVSGQVALTAALDGHRSAALSPIGSELAADIVPAYANAQAGLAPALCVLDHEPRELQLVILAQTAEKRAIREEESVPQWAQDVLTACRSDPAAASAQTSIDLHLASIELAFKVR